MSAHPSRSNPSRHTLQKVQMEGWLPSLTYNPARVTSSGGSWNGGGDSKPALGL
jgi:hypothetical protein